MERYYVVAHMVNHVLFVLYAYLQVAGLKIKVTDYDFLLVNPFALLHVASSNKKKL